MSYLGTGSLPYNAVRIINKADSENLYINQEEKQETRNTEIFQMADEKAADIANKSGLTVALEDFAKVYNFNGKSSSNVSADDAGRGFFSRFLNKLGIDISKNIFKTDEAKQVIEDEGNYYQNDILKDCIQEHGGLQYAKEDDDLYASALNFAKADINAIEDALNRANPRDERGKDKKLDVAEVNSFNSKSDLKYDNLKEMSLTLFNKSELSAEEVASYIVSADTNQDGIITEDEALAVKNRQDDALIADAEEIYKENK